MVETISPVVHGGRARWLGTLALHTLGATGTAALFGAILGWIGQVAGRTVAASGAARPRDDLGGVRARRPDTVPRAGPATPPAGAGLVADVLRPVVRGVVVRRRSRDRVPDVRVVRHARGGRLRRGGERTPRGGSARHGAVRAGARAVGDRLVAIDRPGAEPGARRPLGRRRRRASAHRERRRARRDRDRGRRGIGPGRRRVVGDASRPPRSPRCSCGRRRPRWWVPADGAAR